MMPPKSATAFKWTCEELFNTSEKVYFWTFTAKDAMPAWWFPNTWHAFTIDVMGRFGRFRGVRCFEWHLNHGLHAHALVDLRLPIRELREIGARYGMGLNWVRVADRNAPKYLGKYLAKQHSKLYPGGRQWGRFGGIEFGSRVRDVRTEGDRANHIRQYIAEHPKMARFVAIKMAAQEYDNLLLESCYALHPEATPAGYKLCAAVDDCTRLPDAESDFSGG